MRVRKHFTVENVRECIEFYNTKEEPRFVQLEEGVCGYGTFVMSAKGCRWMIVQEYPVSEWVSHHKVSFCNTLPKVWEQRIEATEQSYV